MNYSEHCKWRRSCPPNFSTSRYQSLSGVGAGATSRYQSLSVVGAVATNRYQSLSVVGAGATSRCQSLAPALSSAICRSACPCQFLFVLASVALSVAICCPGWTRTGTWLRCTWSILVFPRLSPSPLGSRFATPCRPSSCTRRTCFWCAAALPVASGAAALRASPTRTC